MQTAWGIETYTMLSQIVWVMFLAHHCSPKVANNCPKKPKVDFHVNYYKDNSGSDHMGTDSLAASQTAPASSFLLHIYR